MLMLLPTPASLCLRADPVRRQEGQEGVVDLTASKGLSPSKDVLKRLDFQLNAAPGQPLGQHPGEGADSAS